MKIIKLKIISEPQPNSCAILKFTNGAKIKGVSGDITLTCGNCGNSLAEKLEEGQVRNLVLLCQCGKYNRIPLLWERFRLFDIKENWNVWALSIGLLFLIVSQVVQEYNDLTFWAGIIIAILGTVSLLFAKKTVRYFSE